MKQSMTFGDVNFTEVVGSNKSLFEHTDFELEQVEEAS